MSSTAIGNIESIIDGIQKGDVITEYDGEKIVIYRDLWLYQFVNKPTYKPIVIKYIHDGKKQTATVTPTKYYSLGISYYADKMAFRVIPIKFLVWSAE